MTTTTTMPAQTRITASAAAGLAAGPVLAATWIVQGLVRDDYDFTKHPMSLLALGEGGWVQIANFVVTGLLVLTCAAGLRATITGWAPRCVAIIGAGLILSGVFTADPGSGFPAGAPEGTPEISWHGWLHGLGMTMVIVSFIALCVSLRRRYRAAGQPGHARQAVMMVPLVLGIGAVPHLDTFPARLVLASVVVLGYIGLVAKREGAAR